MLELPAGLIRIEPLDLSLVEVGADTLLDDLTEAGSALEDDSIGKGEVFDLGVISNFIPVLVIYKAESAFEEGVTRTDVPVLHSLGQRQVDIGVAVNNLQSFVASATDTDGHDWIKFPERLLNLIVTNN